MLITILNIYNSFNNIKFKNEKKNYRVLDFLKVKYHAKRKGKYIYIYIKINHFTIHTLNTNYYLKYL